MLDVIKKTLWATADKLRANMDAAEYTHLVLGLIFDCTWRRNSLPHTS
jgi:type I restriction enzyme M protein